MERAADKLEQGGDIREVGSKLFVWEREVLLHALRFHVPGLYEHLEQVRDKIGECLAEQELAAMMQELDFSGQPNA